VDALVFVVLSAAQIIFAVIAFAQNTKLLAVFPFFGSILGIFSALGLLTDGDLTTIAGGATNVIATSGSNAFIWTAVSLLAEFLILADVLIIVFKVLHK